MVIFAMYLEKLNVICNIPQKLTIDIAENCTEF